MGGIRVQGNTTGNIAEVDSNNQLKIAANTDPLKAGAARLFVENDPGVVTASANCVSPRASIARRLAVGADALLDSEVFAYTSQNTAKHLYTASSMTMDLNGGRLRTNAAGTVAINTSTRMRTWQHFPIVGHDTPIVVAFSVSFSAAMTTNTTIDVGLFRDGGSGPFAPTDGVYVRASSAGIELILNYNGVETSSGALVGLTDSSTPFVFVASTVYDCQIVLTERYCEFWVNGILLKRMAVTTAQGQPCQSTTLPFAWRHSIGGTAAGAVLQMLFWDYDVLLMDMGHTKPWAHQMSLMGNSTQIQQGAAGGGQLTTYGQSAAPATSTLTNNTAPATNTLGGLYLLPVAITAAESDYPLFAWLNPTGSSVIPSKNFVCTGIRVGEAVVTIAALTGGPVQLWWALGWGSTASSLATTESSTFASATTKIARKEPLGCQSFAATAANGTIQPGFQVDFSAAPKVIYPGQYLHVILRVTGTDLTAGTAQIRGSVLPIGYFE